MNDPIWPSIVKVIAAYFVKVIAILASLALVVWVVSSGVDRLPWWAW